MQFELTEKQYRRLLDLVYIGNWILNSARGQDRFSDYDEVESLLFAKSFSTGMKDLAELWHGQAVPSRAFVTGGIHEAIADYEDSVFFDILAEELAAGIWRMCPLMSTITRSCSSEWRNI